MSLVSLEFLLPDVAARDACRLQLGDGSMAVELLIVEFHCANPECGCERVELQFTDSLTREVLATVSHDLGATETPDGVDGREATLVSAGPQKEIASDLLELFRSEILTRAYHQQLRSHAELVTSRITASPHLRSPHRTEESARSREMQTAMAFDTWPTRPATDAARRAAGPHNATTATLTWDDGSSTLIEFAAPLLSNVSSDRGADELEFCYRVAMEVWNAVVDGLTWRDVDFLRGVSASLGEATVTGIWKELRIWKLTRFADDRRKFVDLDVVQTSDSDGIDIVARMSKVRA